MRQGDQDWWRLADTISTEDRPRALEHNAHAAPQHRLHLALGPVPCAGAIMTVTSSPARALNPRVPSTAANRLLAVFF